MKPIRVLVVDDHPVVREGLVAILRRQEDIEVVGEAATGLEALEKAGHLRPDVVLMDLRLPRLDGVEATRRLGAMPGGPLVIILTTYEEDDLVMAALEAGARGYLLKDAPREEIFRAIRAACAGESLLHPRVAAKLVSRVTRPVSPDPDALSERETEVLRLMASGLANKEIGAGLGIAESTVKSHVASILQKLGTRDRTGAVTAALQRGLIKLPDCDVRSD